SPLEGATRPTLCRPPAVRCHHIIIKSPAVLAVGTTRCFMGFVALWVRRHMSKIARHVVSLTTKNFPIMLVGAGLIATILWTTTVMALAVERVWSMLSGS